MPETVVLTTRIRTTAERLFDLSLDMDDHSRSLAGTRETAVTSTGRPMLGLADEVTFTARHFGIPFRMTARVTELERPVRFVDEQVRGPFASLRHEHSFAADGDATVLTDRLTIRAPLGPIGTVVARMVLVPHLRGLLEVRAAHLRDARTGHLATRCRSATETLRADVSVWRTASDRHLSHCAHSRPAHRASVRHTLAHVRAASVSHVCTVVCEVAEGGPVRILALRDELTSRAFDLPGAWWPEQPGVVGGRDRLAGGSWCVSDIATGTTALVVNRIERRTGTPSRGVLPLLAVAAGESWPAGVDISAMASFLLLLAAPGRATVWSFDGSSLTRADLSPGTHMVTSSGLDAGDPKTVRHLPSFRLDADWPSLVLAQPPSDADSALVVRREFGEAVYATVFGQLITATPGELRLDYSRTPWLPGWRSTTWPPGA